MKSHAYRYLVTMAIFALATPSFAQMAKKDMTNQAGGGHEMMQSMTRGMEQMKSMPMTGDVDKDFATMMRMHHQQAVEMGEMELKNGKDAKMKAMAKKIIKDQRKEIKEFDDWLAKRK